MDLDYYGYSQDVNPDEFEALFQLEEEEMLRDLPNNFIPPSSITSTTNHLDIQIESPSGSTSTEMPFNTSSLSGLPTSISNSLQNLASGSSNSRALLAELLQSASSSSSSSFSTTARNSRRSPPASIQDHIRRKGNLSVSDLVGPIWCETAFQYSILGMTNLKIEDPRRPEKIITPQGNVIVPNKARAQQKEKVLESGTKVHKQLERQVAAKPVYIKTKTREDGWGLRILKLVGSLKSLMKGGIAREVPVFGIIHGKLIIGVIDEISVAALSSKRSSGKTTSSSSSSQDGNKDSSKSPKKTWASQEDWKKEKEREKVHGKGKAREKGQKPLSFAKPSTSNPSTSTTSTQDAPLSSVLKTIMQNATSSSKDDSNLSPSSSSQKAEDQEATSNSTPVASTIAESTRPASSPGKGKGKEKEVDTTPARARYGFYLSDTKTRVSARLPFPEDQKSARFQCMVYKRLLDGLSSGAMLQSSASQRNVAFQRAAGIARDHYPTYAEAEGPSTTRSHSSSSKHPASGSGWLNIDPKGSPLFSYDLFRMLNLNEEVELSQSFVDDAKELWEEWDVSVGKEKEVQIEEEFEDEMEGVEESEVVEEKVDPSKTMDSNVETEVIQQDKVSSELPSIVPETTISSATDAQITMPDALPPKKRKTRTRTEKVISCNLRDIARLLDNTLLELAALAEIGMNPETSNTFTPSEDWKPQFQGSGIQTDLRLVYRLREGRGTFHRRGGRSGGSGSYPQSFGSNNKRKQASSQEMGVDDLDEETQLALAIQMSLEQAETDNLVMTNEKEAEGGVLSSQVTSDNAISNANELASASASGSGPIADAGEESSKQIGTSSLESDSTLQATKPEPIATSSSTSNLSTSNQEATPDDDDEPEVEEDPLLIGVVSFPHNPFTLESHLIDILDLFEGKREIRGVSERNSGRCNFCEFKEGCEWRSEKGKKRAEEARNARLARENERWEMEEKKRLEELKKVRLEELKKKAEVGMDEDELWESLENEEVEIDWGSIETSRAL